MRRNRSSRSQFKRPKRASEPSDDPPQASITGSSVPIAQIPSSDDPSLPLPPLTTEMDIGSPRTTPHTCCIQNNSASVRTYQEPADIGTSVPASSLVRARSGSRGSGDLKKTIVASTKLHLQAAVTALKFAPIKNIGQVPDTLLACISIYEDVKGNSEELKQLCVVIQQAQASVLEPLQKWTGEVPPELDSLVQEVRVALEKQMEDIKAVREKNIVKRTILAQEIARQITGMKSCLSDAIHRFQNIDFNSTSCRARIGSIRDIETQASSGRASLREKQIRVPTRHATQDSRIPTRAPEET
ncbi:uncharacterized protein EI90DRAFT_3135825 [Cantharellus anzutake]|uniref:uncharacterized protein n=1 Tax=Cantharellus anzutake TaxID=1750568 RepID=UPI0019088F08|nr:uncharacterized protein EI90DRAFT_3135825 [Cantharellus anzutake]KAF8314625.1 hypothetical protein EI90DRAFT_3135825 [Cantharellus anzutake]